LVATSFTDQHGEEGVPGFGDTSPRRQQQTMTSREIAELVESRHDNVKRTIDTLSAKGVIPSTQAEEKAYAEFHLAAACGNGSELSHEDQSRNPCSSLYPALAKRYRLSL